MLSLKPRIKNKITKRKRERNKKTRNRNTARLRGSVPRYLYPRLKTPLGLEAFIKRLITIDLETAENKSLLYNFLEPSLNPNRNLLINVCTDQVCSLNTKSRSIKNCNRITHPGTHLPAH